jgi:hypothetical protein
MYFASREITTNQWNSPIQCWYFVYKHLQTPCWVGWCTPFLLSFCYEDPTQQSQPRMFQWPCNRIRFMKKVPTIYVWPIYIIIYIISGNIPTTSGPKIWYYVNNVHLHVLDPYKSIPIPMTDPWCCYLYGVPWIPSIYPRLDTHVSIKLPAPAGSVMGLITRRQVSILTFVSSSLKITCGISVESRLPQDSLGFVLYENSTLGTSHRPSPMIA